jgi:acid stress-induced BolA-like protein IbaG/YrbA
VSPRFEGLSPVAAQRLVYQALGDFMTTDVHALEMRTFTPDAWQRLAGRA